MAAPDHDPWPPLPLAAWSDTHDTLHRWLQIVGKVRLALSPWLNHSWHATLYPSASGLTTGLIPYPPRAFQLGMDFLAHRLTIRVSDGRAAAFALEPQSVATFDRRLRESLAQLGIRVEIFGRPNELPDAVPFAQDEAHRSYDPEYVRRFWRILIQTERVFQQFRARFIGKASPIHLFWGGADLALTRFSGRRAPSHPGGIPHLPDWVTREAYSHEVSSAGFWAGGGAIDYPAFYSYAYPEPAGFAAAMVRPGGAFYSRELGEFVLPYETVRTAEAPDALLLEFLQSTYEAAADLGRWDRQELEQTETLPPLRSRPGGPEVGGSA